MDDIYFNKNSNFFTKIHAFLLLSILLFLFVCAFLVTKFAIYIKLISISLRSTKLGLKHETKLSFIMTEFYFNSFSLSVSNWCTQRIYFGVVNGQFFCLNFSLILTWNINAANAFTKNNQREWLWNLLADVNVTTIDIIEQWNKRRRRRKKQ